MPSEASPRVRLQGKGDATYFLWKRRWFGARREDGIPARYLLRYVVLFPSSKHFPAMN